MNKTQKGFTLIELLVVVAIIGVLSTVVLTSLSTARARANDAKVKATFSSIRTQGWIVSDMSLMCGDSKVMEMLNSINSAANLGVLCSASSAAWVVYAQNPLSTGEIYCTDSTGFLGEIKSSFDPVPTKSCN